MARPINPKRHYDLLGRAIRRMERQGKEDFAKAFAAVLQAMKKSKTGYSPKAWTIISSLPAEVQEEVFDTRDVLQTHFEESQVAA